MLLRGFHFPLSLSLSNLEFISKRQLHGQRKSLKLDELLESTVDGRTDVGNVFVEINGCNSTLADALGGELELLQKGVSTV